MAVSPSTLWAAVVAVGAKDGTSLSDAAAIDPADANDIWTILNADTVAALGTTVKLCTDGTATSVATVCPMTFVYGAADNPYIFVGRNAADTDDNQCILDAGGGAFDVVGITNCRHCRFHRITAQNTNKASGNHAWAMNYQPQYLSWFDCVGSDAYTGWDFASGARYMNLFRCHAAGNAYRGFAQAGNIQTANTHCFDCIANNNGNDGFRMMMTCLRCVADTSGSEGYDGCLNVIGCVAYNSTSHGWIRGPNYHNLLVDFIAVDNGAYGVRADDGWTMIVNCAHYNNTSGGVFGTDNTRENTITLTADPFTDAASGDFSLNDVAGGGADCRGIAHVAPDGNFTSYNDLGAVQHEDAGGGGRTIHAIG